MAFKVIYKSMISSVLTVIILIALNQITYAQTTVAISDTAFLNVLKKAIPQVIDVNNKLIVAQAKAFVGEIYIENSNITNIDELSYFELVTKITVYKTQLSVFPSISNLKNLEMFICNGNKLTEFPDFSKNINIKQIIISNNQLTSLPNISDFSNLEVFDVSYNKIQTLPLFSNLPSLTSIVAFHNKISFITSFENIPKLYQLVLDSNNLTNLDQIYSIQSLKQLYLRGNKLPFSELNKLTSHSSFSSFLVFPQDTIGTKKYVQFFNLNPKSIKLDNITNAADYAFDWYKNGVYLKTINGVDSLYFTNLLLLSDTGKYTCLVKCTDFTSPFFGKSVTYNTINLNFGICKNFNSITYQFINKDCKTGTDISINESFNLGAYGPFIYTLKNDTSNITTSYNSSKMTNLQSGTYSITIQDINKNCMVEIPSIIKIDSIPNCNIKNIVVENKNNYITPDGDGIDDSYYINMEGSAQIYNRNGKLIKTLKTPAYWDGTGNNGILQGLGYYVIIINGETKQFLTLLN